MKRKRIKEQKEKKNREREREKESKRKKVRASQMSFSSSICQLRKSRSVPSQFLAYSPDQRSLIFCLLFIYFLQDPSFWNKNKKESIFEHSLFSYNFLSLDPNLISASLLLCFSLYLFIYF